MKYDIFISYRRIGGYETAKHLYDLLLRDGYNVSFDIDTLRKGDFSVQLMTRVEQCKDFILIIDPHTFDKTFDPEIDPETDWVRCELAHALKHNKNIIPVFLNGVSGFPKGLPADIVEVEKIHGPKYDIYYFNDFYKQLCSRFLISKGRKNKLIKGFFVVMVVLVLGFLFLLNNKEEEVLYYDPISPHTTDKVQFKEFVDKELEEALDSISSRDIIAAVRLWNEEAVQGDIRSQFNLGLAYIAGLGCNVDTTRAVKYFMQSAAQDLPEAQYSLAVCYDNSWGVAENLDKAAELYGKAAEQGLVEAQSDYGVFCMIKNNSTESYKWLSKSAEQGYAPAQYNLAWGYANTNNVTDAMFWMEKSAAQDYETAKLALANVYLYGENYLRNIDQALLILYELVDKGNAVAQYLLGTCYNQGIGLEPDFDKVIDLVERSAEQGYAPALTDMGLWYASGSAYFSQDYDMALKYFHKAAKMGFPLAQYYIGQMYTNGWGVKKNLHKAERWYRKAAKQGVDMQYVRDNQQKQMEYLNAVRSSSSN